jgi:hypothetical protein
MSACSLETLETADFRFYGAAAHGGGAAPLALEVMEYDLFIRISNTRRRKLEPEVDAYLGAYIKSDKALDGCVRTFEGQTGVTHAVYAHNMAAGGEFPFRWVLELTAAMKTPLITVNPQNRDIPFDMALITLTAKDAGRFNIPMFINLYPVARGLGYNPAEYVRFFRNARAVFNEHAPNAAIIWSVNGDDVFTTEAFYPGAEYADWVGIGALANISDRRHNDVMRLINHFYFQHQHNHPVIVTGLGVSHYTTATFSFHTRQAAEEMERIYASIALNFPRIKAVVYANYDGNDVGNGGNPNNYRITGERLLIDTYKRITTDNRFTAAVDEKGEGSRDVTVKSPFRVIERNGAFFIPRLGVADMFFRNPKRLEGAEVFINDGVYYPLRLLEVYENFKITIDDERRIITIN